MAFIKKYHLLLFFVALTVLNFVQAANTVLLNDEAYYWVYSRFLAWGYFDHPPMIAVLIKAGYFLFHNELGVRFFIVFINTFTLAIIYKLLPQRNNKLFYAIVCSIGLMQLGGFIAVPDMPLVFFTALFFLIYKKFIEQSSILNTILLGVVMALMLYSKYHAVLIILFTLFSNIKLLAKGKAYLALLICAALFMPHLYWQYQHGFPSVQYHLFERNETSYKPSFTLEYIGGQILICGPLMGWLFIWSAYKYKTVNRFQSALKFCVFGFYMFFLITSFRGRVEANWTAPVLVPLIILSHTYLLDKEKWKRILTYSVPLSLTLVFAIRIFMILNSSSSFIVKSNEFLQNKKWSQQIKSIAKDLPLVFINSYQKAAKYWFYSGTKAFSLNTPDYRRNNYNFWPIEKSLQGKTVFAIGYSQQDFFTDSAEAATEMIRANKIDSFYSYASVQLKIKNGFSFDQYKFISAEVNVKKQERDNFNIEDTAAAKTIIFIYKEKVFVKSCVLNAKKLDNKNDYYLTSSSPVILSKGKYTARLAISSSLKGYPTLNSNTISIIIK